MKTKRTFLLLILACSALFAFAQQNTPELSITKKVKEQDGTFTSETIVKKGKAATEFNIDEYVKANKADNTDLDIRLEGGDEERSVTIRGSQGPRNTGEEDVEIEVEEIVRNVNGRVNRSIERVNKNINEQNWNWNSDRSYYIAGSNDAFLGVEEDDDEDTNKSGVVVEITENSAADKAGLRDNDVLLQLNDTKIDKWSDITAFMSKAKKGDKVTITYSRNGKEMTAEAVLTNRCEVSSNKVSTPKKRGFLGVSEFGDIEDEPGVRVSITKNSGADKGGLKKGDVILQLNDAEINDFEDIEDAMEDVKPGDKIKIKYKRDGKESTIEATAGEQTAWDWGQTDWEDSEINIQTKKGCLGICNNNATTGDRRGAAIVNMACNSAAKAAGLLEGDIILEINGNDIEDSADLWQELTKYDPNATVNIAYVRDGKDLVTDATLHTCDNALEQITMTDTDEWGNASERRFYAWDMEEADEEALKTQRIITIRRAADSDVPVLNPVKGYENAPVSNDRSLELEYFAAYPPESAQYWVLEFKTSPVPTLVQLFDMNGRQLFLEELNAFNGHYRQTFDLLELSQNMLLVRIQQGENIFQEQVFID